MKSNAVLTSGNTVMKKLIMQILPTHPSALPDAVSGWAHLLRLWQKILIEMIEQTVPGWERGNAFDLLLFEGLEGKTRGLNVKRAALNEWIGSLDTLPTFYQFLAWIRKQEGNMLDDAASRSKWNTFASGYKFDAPTIAGIEKECGISLGELELAGEINVIVDAMMFHKMLAGAFEKKEALVA